MKKLLAISILLLCGCAARSQSITVTFKSKAENLTTIDAIGAVKPCNGIDETLNTSDIIGVVAFTPPPPVPISMVDNVAPVDFVSVNSSLHSILSEAMTVSDFFGFNFVVIFPQACKLSTSGNIVTCTIP